MSAQFWGARRGPVIFVNPWNPCTFISLPSLNPQKTVPATSTLCLGRMGDVAMSY